MNNKKSYIEAQNELIKSGKEFLAEIEKSLYLDKFLNWLVCKIEKHRNK